MAVVTPPLFQTIDGAYDGASLGLPYRDLVAEGVVSSGDLAVTQRGAGANMSVDVAAGVAWVRGDDSVSQPAYRVYNDATVNLAVDAAHASLARVDRVVAEVRDAAFSGVSTDWRLRVITGTPAGSPVAPALPNSAMSLATVSVPALDTAITNSQITDTRTAARADGEAERGYRDGVVATKTSATSIMATSAATGNTIVTTASFTTDGGLYEVLFSAAEVTTGGSGAALILNLFVDGALGAELAGVNSASGGSLITPVSCRMELRPGVGAHTFDVRGWRTSANGSVSGGNGVGGNHQPTVLRVRKIAE